MLTCVTPTSWPCDRARVLWADVDASHQGVLCERPVRHVVRAVSDPWRRNGGGRDGRRRSVRSMVVGRVRGPVVYEAEDVSAREAGMSPSTTTARLCGTGSPWPFWPARTDARWNQGPDVLWGDAPQLADLGCWQFASSDHRLHRVAVDEQQIGNFGGAEEGRPVLGLMKAQPRHGRMIAALANGPRGVTP